MNAGDDEELIVELFAHRRERYDEPSVLRLTRATAARLRTAIAEGEVEPIDEGGARSFVWADVAQLALARWTPRMISAALERAGARDALPPLNQTHTIRVELPLYQIRLLHWLAARWSEEGKPPLNVSDVLERQLDGMATLDGVDAVLIEGRIPGFRSASQFPFREEPAPAAAERCVYCGAAPPTESGACAECAARNEPPRVTKNNG
ncbi:MAG TPA: hypothetical protein VEO74_10565 [Thermoanaerobaculia bacterium]|nr:hypothetical protein [Thermoanaerobaculia bacterium]